ncbi:MAG TPA: hypothetical protein VLX92_26580 [Kofleriaceae bacterium]|nr:hypothetical protein [Kofleriaceae bacterium]
MRIPALVLVLAVAVPAHAGELDIDAGAQATTTAWNGDHGGGAMLTAGYWFMSWLGASFIGKEQYATVDDRLLSYFSLNASARATLGSARLVGTLGVVHQHEEPRTVWEQQPLMSALGVADGIRHRFAGRAGASLQIPLRTMGKADPYLGFDVDATVFGDTDKGPRWMMSAGVSVGFLWDFARVVAK